MVTRYAPRAVTLREVPFFHHSKPLLVATSDGDGLVRCVAVKLKCQKHAPWEAFAEKRDVSEPNQNEDLQAPTITSTVVLVRREKFQWCVCQNDVPLREANLCRTFSSFITLEETTGNWLYLQ